MAKALKEKVKEKEKSTLAESLSAMSFLTQESVSTRIVATRIILLLQTPVVPKAKERANRLNSSSNGANNSSSGDSSSSNSDSKEANSEKAKASADFFANTLQTLRPMDLAKKAPSYALMATSLRSSTLKESKSEEKAKLKAKESRRAKAKAKARVSPRVKERAKAKEKAKVKAKASTDKEVLI